MRTLTIRLPERLAASLEREAQRAQVSKSAMVRSGDTFARRPTPRPRDRLAALVQPGPDGVACPG